MTIFTRPLRKALCISLITVLFSQWIYSQQVPRGLTAQNNEFVGFYEYKPTDYDLNPTVKYPVIIFLHGIGERGNGTTDLPRVLANAIPRYINQGHPMRFFWNGKWETFLVLSPQLSNNYGSWPNFYVEEMINYAKQNLRIDTNRIMLTGLSLGGGGVWNYPFASGANARKLAAIAPVCGVCPMGNACNIAAANLPVWAFHAIDDQTVGAGCTSGTIGNINSCNPAVKPIMSIYPDGGHGIWDRSFDTEYNFHNPNMYEWFLGQNKSLPVNVLPVARAGNDQSALLNGSVTLDGTASYDTDGNLVRYIWRKIGGPNFGNIVSPLGSTTVVSNLGMNGVYQYELTVVDNRTGWTKDTVSVTVSTTPAPNQPPVANAGTDVTISLPTNTASLVGTGSYDPNGSITSYAWSKINGPTQFTISSTGSASTTATNLVQGTYQFRLVVTDNNGAADDDTVTVVVNSSVPGNQPPVSNAGADIAITLPTNSVSLNGSASSDPDGSITNFLWSKISGPSQFNIASAGSASTSATNLVQGTYQFRLQVTDNNGGTDADTVVVTVNASGTPPEPIANAGADIVITLPTNNSTLNGSASYDQDGGFISAYNWTKISGPATYTIANPNAVTTALTNLVQGVYLFRLLVTDNGAQQDADTVMVTVNPALPVPNQPPVAIAGSDNSITLPTNSATINGSGSSDPNGTITNYNWTKISGPSQYNITNATSVSTTVTGLLQGSYLFRLVVTDNNGATDDDTVAINVYAAPNQPPVANAGPDNSITLPVSTVTLSGSASSDPNGTITNYSWVKLGGPSIYNITSPNSVTTTATSLQQGTYLFRLTVTDNNGATDTDTVVIVVNPAPNQRPVANAGGDIQVTMPNNSATLSGSASSDPDGNINAYSWSKISGPSAFTLANATSVSASVTNLVQGTYQFRLVVTDNSGATDDDTVSIIVSSAPPPPNLAPVANAGADVTITLPNTNTILNGTGSVDPDGSIVSFNWSKVSGPTSYSIINSGSATTVVGNLIAGTYQFRLVVSDNNGATNDDLITVTVLPSPPPPNQLPVANAGADQTINLPAASVQLNGSASYDPDGSIVSFSWNKINGAGGTTIVNSTTASPTINGLLAGVYTFELTVTDNNGSTATDQVTITVIAALNQAPVARAGNDMTFTDPMASVSFNGSQSFDPDGSITSYQWRQLSGPVAASLLNADRANAAASGFQPGNYQFELTVTDNNGATDKDTIGLLLINTMRDEERITAYPNPASSYINFVCVTDKTGDAILNIYDANGKLVKTQLFEKAFSSQELKVNVADLKSGIYVAEITIANKKRMIIRFAKQ